MDVLLFSWLGLNSLTLSLYWQQDHSKLYQIILSIISILNFWHTFFPKIVYNSICITRLFQYHIAFLMYSAWNIWLSWAPPQNYSVVLECSSLCLGKLIPSGSSWSPAVWPLLQAPAGESPNLIPAVSQEVPSFTHVSLTRAPCTVNESEQL